MTLQDTIQTAIRGLTTHKSRALLTILGIVIGITSITLVMAIGAGAQDLIVGQIQGLGTKNIYIIPGQESGLRSGGNVLVDSLREKDYQDMRNKDNVPDAEKIVPLVFGSILTEYESETFNGTIIGSTEDIFGVYDVQAVDIDGSFFTQEDVALKTKSAVIGSRMAKELFGSSSSLGQKIKIRDDKFRVIGVIPPKGQQAFVNLDETMLVPYTTAQDYVLGIRYFQRILVEAKTEDSIPLVKKDIELLLRDNHNISDPNKDDFFVQTQEDLIGTISTITDILTILLTSVAAISLLVGGIGIMNIMLVSVTERTREIGLRKSIGATNKNILQQFLSEAVLLTVSGGVVGIILGTILSIVATWAIGKFANLNFSFVFPLEGALLGILVSMAIGFIFGVFPARAAAKKSPMEALRYE